MNVIDQLERRFGRFAIPGLLRMVIVLNALVFVLGQFNPGLESFLALTRDGIARHEYWRLFTYILIPEADNFLFMLLAVWFFWMIADGLERAMGAFRLNLFYLVGMFGTTLAALAFGAEFSNSALNLSLLFAFAWFYPDMVIYVYMILPLRIRWVAWISAALLMFNFVRGSGGTRMAILASMINYILFFGPQIVAGARQRQEVAGRRRRFAEASLPENEPLHRCEVCKKTENDSRDLEFRVARDGKEYCMEHLPKVR